MFKDLFNFGKVRTLKESIGFYLFYAGVFIALTTLADVVGL